MAPSTASLPLPPAGLEAGAGPAQPEAVAAAVPALVWSSDLQGRVDWLNPAWTAFTGRAAAELHGEGWMSAVHPEDLERCVGIRRTSFEADAPYAMDVRLRRHDGQFRWMLDQGVPRRDASGRLVGYVGSMVDIQERKVLEEALAERTQALRLAERRQGQFLATLSHEMRNPLAPIANAASVLRTLESSNPILVRLREILDRQVGRLGRLVDELVDATRAAQGQISLVRERVAVESIVQAAVARSHERITAGGHALEVDIADQALEVQGDPGRLAQALGNVIDNAAKFSPEPGTIRVQVRQVARTAHIAVRDGGRGIDPTFLPHVFELFAQEDQSLGRTLGGLGVGLSLARRIAQLHGGDVEAFSAGSGQGSEVILWLPLLVDGARANGGPPVAAKPLRDSYRVLVVEDNADARESLRLSMELWGNEVRAAADGPTAIDLCRSWRPDIVLCDLGLPGMDGLSLARTLKASLAGQPVVLAAVTGYAGGDEQQRAHAAGFDAFLVKPLDADSLSRLLRSAS